MFLASVGEELRAYVLVRPDRGGHGLVEARVPSPAIYFYAGRLLGAGTEVIVESAPQLIAALREKAQAVTGLYPQACSPTGATATRGAGGR